MNSISQEDKFVDTIGVALIGSGYISHYHARGLMEVPGVKLRALCSLDGKAAEKFAKEYGIDEVTDKIDSLVGREDIQAVVISTPNKFHAPYTIEFLKNDPREFLVSYVHIERVEFLPTVDYIRSKTHVLKNFKRSGVNDQSL